MTSNGIRFFVCVGIILCQLLFIYLVFKNSKRMKDRFPQMVIFGGSGIAIIGLSIRAYAYLVFLIDYMVDLFTLLMITIGIFVVFIGVYLHFKSYSKTYFGDTLMDKIINVPYGSKRFVTLILATVLIVFLSIMIFTAPTRAYRLLLFDAVFFVIGIMLILNEWSIHRSLTKKKKTLLSPFKIKKFRKDVLLLNIWVEFVNLYLLEISPDLGRNLIKRIFQEFGEENPLLFGGYKLTEQNTLNYNSIARNTDRLAEENRIHMISQSFSALMNKMLEVHVRVTEPNHARAVLRRCYNYIKANYGDIDEFVYIIRRLPEGISDEEKMEVVGEEELKNLVKQYTKEFLNSERKYQVLFERTNEGISVLDGELRILDLNAKGEELLGIERTDVIGENILDFVNLPKKEHERAMEQVGELRGKKNYVEGTYHIKGVHGKTHIMDIRATCIKKEEQVIVIFVLFRAITEKIYMEERDTLLHSLIRHDLKNKTLVSQGYLDLLLESQELSEEERDFAERAYRGLKEGTHLLEKIKQIRDADLTEKIDMVNISSFIRTAIQKNQQMAEEKGFELESNLKGHVAKGGPLLEELFSNLIYNSLLHSQGTRIRISTHADNSSVTVSVEDDGEGIPEDKKEKVFDIGVRSSDSHGSGLGLHLVKRIAETYGGYVELKDSELGGARFDVILKKR